MFNNVLQCNEYTLMEFTWFNVWDTFAFIETFVKLINKSRNGYYVVWHRMHITS